MSSNKGIDVINALVISIFKKSTFSSITTGGMVVVVVEVVVVVVEVVVVVVGKDIFFGIEVCFFYEIITVNS